MGWQRRVGHVANYIEGYYDAMMHAYTKYLDRNPFIQIIAYLGFGSAEQVYLKGRVLKDKHIGTGDANDSRWRNFVNTFKRFNSSEVPQARLGARFGDWNGETTADEEGFFEFQFTPSKVLDKQRLWHDVKLELLDPTPRSGGVSQTGSFLIPPTTARFGVISDMDDTVIQTGAGNMLGTAAKVLFGNARTRLPYPGVAQFYQALQGKQLNPLFYVSSSPWNLYDLLTEFFRLHEIPVGPLFLRDWGVSEEEVLPTDHRHHKMTSIRKILDTLPGLPFLLIGDSSQEDAEIYSEVESLYPGRIGGIYIRDVSQDPERVKSILALAKQVEGRGSRLILAQDTTQAEADAAARGWI